MSDEIKIGLDGTPLSNMAKPAIEALKELGRVADSLSPKSIDRLSKSNRDLVNSLKGLASVTSTEMQKVVTAMAGALDKGVREAKAKGTAAGKQFAQSLEEEASRATIRVSAPRLVLPSGLSASVGGKGIESAATVLQEAQKLMAETGARSTAQIAAEAAGLRDLQKISNDTYRSRLNWYKAADTEAKTLAKSEADAAKEAQRVSNDTFRSRLNWYKSTAVEAKQAARAESDSLKEAQRVSNDTFRSRQAWQKSIDQATAAAARREAESAKEAQRVSNDTYRMRLNFEKATQAEAARTARQQADALKEQNRLRALDAAFQAAKPQGQLNSATRVAGFLDAGGSQADAVSRYGAAAVAATSNLAGLRREVELGRKSTKDLADGHRALAEQSHNVHGALRGVAGAANALFLTYGALVPLTTAFFAASAVRESITAYKDLERQIGFVLALSDKANEASSAQLRGQVNVVGQAAGYDPVEASKGLRLLAQSGLDANQAIKGLPAVLETARVGELSVQQTTETLTGAVHAFGLSMDRDLGRVGDVLAKSGAVSNTSVGSMSESMKQASTVAKEYNQSIEDVSTALVALAKNNITGSSAGTAYANMMRELVNPKGGAKKAADALGFTAFRNDGSIKNLYDEILPELEKKLSNFTKEAQSKLISDLTNNRGEKALFALLSMTDKDIAEMRQKVGDSTGFVKDANRKLTDDLQGDMDRLKAAMTATFSEAGAQGAQGLRDAIASLSQVVGSPEFLAALTGLVKGVAALASGAAGLASVLMQPTAQIAAMSAAALAFAPVRTALTAGLATMGVNFASTAAASAAAATGVAGAGAAGAAAASGLGVLGGVAATVLRTLAGFTIITGVVMLLGSLWEKMSEKSGTDLAIANGNRYIGNLRNQIAELDRLIAKKAQADGMGNVSERMGLKLELDAAEKRAKEVRESGAGFVSAYRGRDGKVNVIDPELQRAEGRVNQLRGQLDTLNTLEIQRVAKQRQLDGRSTWDPKNGDRFDAMNAGLTGEAAAKANGFNPNHRVIATGGQGYDPNPDKSAARKALQEATADYKNMLKEVELLIAGSDQLGRSVDESLRVQESSLKQSYDRGVISYGEYQARLSALQTEQSTVRTVLAESERDAVKRGLEELKTRAANMQAKGRAGVPEQLANDIQSMTQKLIAAEEKVRKLVNDHSIRQGQALTEALKPASDVIKNAELNDAKDAERLRQEVEKLRVKGAGLDLSEREQYVQGEILRVTGEQSKKLAERQALMEELVRLGVFSADKLKDPETYAVYEKLAQIIESLKISTESAAGVVRGEAGRAYDNKKFEGIGQRVSGSIESSVKSGLVAGLTGDTEALANLGKSFQKTIAQSLVDAFYDAFVKDAVDNLGKSLAKSLANSLGGSGGGGGGGGSSGSGWLGGLVNVGMSLFGGGAMNVGYTASAMNTANAVGMAGGDSLGTLLGLAGLSGGGYTGNGGVGDIAGFVHGQEFVLNAPATAALGRPLLEQLNKVKGYQAGGYVSRGSTPAFNDSALAGSGGQSVPGGLVFAPQTTINVDSRSDRGAILADVSKVVNESQRQYTEGLKRIGVLPA